MKNLLKPEKTSTEKNQKDSWKSFALGMKEQLKKLKEKGIELPIFTL
jgi:hypothetical protein